MSAILQTKFYEHNSEIVAKALLGKVFVRKIKGEVLKGRIVETEAYLSSGDEASHNFKGKNKRNLSLYKEGGHAYVHAMRHYFLLDVVTEELNVPGSVLIRAVEPLEGVEYMKKVRGVDTIENLANGPSKFCMAFKINREFDGVDLKDPNSLLYILDTEETIPEDQIEISGRIGISRAKDAPLRFWVKGNSYVSRIR
jgi:DNA-3-methyladenine glycosylase